eukprot:1302177-Amphidinium_carterae.1
MHQARHCGNSSALSPITSFFANAKCDASLSFPIDCQTSWHLLTQTFNDSTYADLSLSWRALPSTRILKLGPKVLGNASLVAWSTSTLDKPLHLHFGRLAASDSNLRQGVLVKLLLRLTVSLALFNLGLPTPAHNKSTPSFASGASTDTYTPVLGTPAVGSKFQATLCTLQHFVSVQLECERTAVIPLGLLITYTCLERRCSMTLVTCPGHFPLCHPKSEVTEQAPLSLPYQQQQLHNIQINYF